jgi:hypothetical protein
VEFLQDVTPVFEFPFSMETGNEVVETGVIFSTLSKGVTYINNIGDGDTGVDISFFGPAETPIITNLTTGEYIQVDTTLLDGQQMVITTDFGNKRVWIVDTDGAVIDAFQHITALSTFWQLRPGKNGINFDAAVGSDNASVTIKYKIKYAAI